MILWGESIQYQNSKKTMEAVRQLLHVSYLELNGPSQGIDDDTPWFDPENGYVNPDILKSLSFLIARTNASPEEIRRIFDETAQRVHKSMKLTVSPKQAWTQIEAEIQFQQ